MSAFEYVVTGAAGFIGSQMVWHLLEQGKAVRATDMRSPSWMGDYYGKVVDGQLEFVMADLTDLYSLYAVTKGARYAVHSGALFDHAASYDDLLRVNLSGTRNFFKAAAASGLEKVIHIGSMSVYGHNMKPDNSEFAINETKSPDPADPYALSKQCSRVVAADFNGKGGMQVRIVDPAGVFGPHSVYGNVGIIKALIDGMMLLPDGGKHRASMVHSEDVCRLCYHLLHYDDGLAGNNTQNLSYLSADTSPVTAREMMQMIWDEIPGRVQKKFMKGLTGKLPVKRGVVMPVAHLVDVVAKLYNATLGAMLGKRMRPDLDPKAIDYGFGDHSADPGKGLRTGFELKYPRTEQTIKSVMDWHKREGLLSKVR